MTKKITIPYFPPAFKYMVIPVLIAGGGYLAFIGYWPWSIMIVVIVVMILTTGYVTEIDLRKKTYSDYIYFLSFRMSEESATFNRLEKIVITKGSYAQNVNTRSRSTALQWSDYTATLLHDDGGNLNLITRNEKSELLKDVREFADFLRVEVEDRTSGHVNTSAR